MTDILYWSPMRCRCEECTEPGGLAQIGGPGHAGFWRTGYASAYAARGNAGPFQLSLGGDRYHLQRLWHPVDCGEGARGRLVPARGAD